MKCRLSGSIGFETVAAYPPRQARGCAIRGAEHRGGKYASWTNRMSTASEHSIAIRVQHRGAYDTSEGQQRHAFCPDECDAAPTSKFSLRCLESAIMNGQIASAVIAVAAVAVAGPNASPRKP